MHLEKFGIRPSQKRLMLFGYLQKYRTHPTVDEMYGELHELIPTLSKTTVYNTMDLFVQRGVVAALNIEDKNQRFDAETSPHAHFRCTECGKIHDVFLDRQAYETIGKISPADCVVKTTEIYFKGICTDCKILKNKEL